MICRSLHRFGRAGSGARLLLVAAQGGDLGTQLVGTLQVAPGEGDGEGELQLFELVVTFFLGVAA
jgi:hypothetical protein